MTPRVCPYCHQGFRHSIYHPDQVVCSSAECQRRRRAEYHRKKIAEDPNYRGLCADSQTYWKERNRDYARRYRAKSKNRKSVADAGESALEELLRFLRRVKNNAAKNNLAVNERAHRRPRLRLPRVSRARRPPRPRRRPRPKRLPR